MNNAVEVWVNEALVGQLQYRQEGRRESSAFAYDPAWLARPERFPIDPLLPLVRGYQYPTPRKGRSPSFGCFADSEPDGWGRTVIDRDRQKRGIRGPANAFDYLAAVHDESRVGALRLKVPNGEFLSQPTVGQRATPPLIHLAHLVDAARAVEEGTETSADLQYLLGEGSPLGGQRPKATIRDADGGLALGKFPSLGDQREVVRGEILGLALARRAGIDAARARLVIAGTTPVAVIKRFDRDAAGHRLPYASAETFLGVTDEAAHSYLEMTHALRQHGGMELGPDIEELWRRLVFGILITNLDDHLHNHGFLHVAHGQWRLAPAFDVNPTPAKARELKTWISEDLGPDASIDNAMEVSGSFGIPLPRAKEILGKVEGAVSTWRKLATSREIGMSRRQADAYADAFEHEERAKAVAAAAASITPAKAKNTRPRT